ncbi:MAG: RibD family protein [Burkholderiales bacterium]
MPVIELFPKSGQTREISGLYLAHRLHTLGSAETPLVYANFVQSLDGRIAANGKLPESLANASDFRLFLELQAQADCLITHGGYSRAVAEGQLDDVLQVGITEQTRDLKEWRAKQGLPPQPTVVVASASLDFPLPQSLATHAQRVFIATGYAADKERVLSWERKGYEVLRAGPQREVEGAPLIAALARLGFKSIYLVAGPLMLATMLRDRVLSRLYLTISHQILGGENFHTLFRGEKLEAPAQFELRSLHYDSAKPQSFAQFDCCHTVQRA